MDSSFLSYMVPSWHANGNMGPAPVRGPCAADALEAVLMPFILLVRAVVECLTGIAIFEFDSTPVPGLFAHTMARFAPQLRLGQLIGFLLSVLFSANAAPNYEPVRPPSYPLAVRNPYLSTWIPGSLVENLPSALPQFWAGQNLSWAVIARVDGTAYSLLGVPDPGDNIKPATVQSAQYTSTHSIFTLAAGPATFTLDFLSPVSPSNYLRHSLPFSYLTVSVSGSDLSSVQVYSDIDGTWTGQSSDTSRTFERTGTTSLYCLSVNNAATYSESADMSLWGEAVLASRPSATSTLYSWSGDRQTARSQFAGQGKLPAQQLSWTPGGVVAFAHDLGHVIGSQSVTFAVGYVREQAINYLGEPYTGYYRAKYPKTVDAVSHFLDDYEDALNESHQLDSKISSAAKDVAGQKYADIVTLSVRQAYGAIDVTIPNESLDTTNVLAFIKELSSNGNLNTVDIITPAFPIYYVIEPDFIKLLLEPIMRYLKAGRWHLPYAIHDLGTHYPNATGHDDQQAEPMPIEESGNLLILALAYQRATGDSSWPAQYKDVLQKYADYLVHNGINIANQLSANDAAGPLPNETNLAIKAAVGLKAFGNLTGLGNYSRIGEEHATLLYDDGLATDAQKTHFVLEYPDKPSSWKTPYNLYPDVLFDLETFPDTAYTMGSDFFPTVRGEYGVALDNRLDWAKSDWNIWLAGTFGTSSSTRDQFVDDLWAFMTNGLNTWPFSDRYVSTSAQGRQPGVAVLCRARPTVGGHLALLAFKGPRSLSVSGGTKRALSENLGFDELGEEL